MLIDVLAAHQALEAFLDDVAPGWDRSKTLVAEAVAISEAYTRSRAIDDDAAASPAYLAHFGPRAIAAVAVAAAAVPHRPQHVLDVGGGSGASALAWMVAGVPRVTVADRSRASLKMASRLLGAGADIQTADFQNTRSHEADLLASAFLLGELELAEPEVDERRADESADRSDDDDAREARRAHTLAEALLWAAPNAKTLCLVDAGDRPRARRLQHLRRALQDRAATILGPCPHDDVCPALLRAGDWCHHRTPKGLPPRLAAFAAAVGRDDDAMSLSWLTLATSSPTEAAAGPRAPRVPRGLLVLGEPLKEKGRVRIPVCGAAGTRFVQVLKRHKDVFRAAAELPRGALLPSPPSERPETPETPETSHTSVEPATCRIETLEGITPLRSP